jgi:RNA polymerase sigma factor (sigma-70 family)
VSDDELVTRLSATRREFLALVEAVRPDLHRYCARMTGSVAEGEDVVQETLARAYYAIPELEQLPALRPWLFQIAHNRALDHLRRYDRRMGQPLETIDETPDEREDPESALLRGQALEAALSRFLELPPAHRSCVILKDVLGHSLEEIAALLGLTVPGVKAALHRGRVRLAELSAAERPVPPSPTPALVRYAALFNARDWEAVRRMLADDVRLDLVSRVQKAGKEVGAYFTNYAKAGDYRAVPAWLDGREVLAIYRSAGDERPDYFVELSFTGERITFIRDFRYVPYIGREASFQGLEDRASSAGRG